MAPSLADLEELWRKVYEHYIGGTSMQLRTTDFWITRVYAYGIGMYEPPVVVAPAPPSKPQKRKARSVA